VASDSALTTSHSIRLSKLVTGRTYSFYVVSVDAAGNATTNNNSGAYFSFVGVATPIILLVDAYEPVNGSPVIPDSAYTNALTAAGYSFAHWKVSGRLDRRRLQFRSLESLRARLPPALRPATVSSRALADH
jgi:hypothetical protein